MLEIDKNKKEQDFERTLQKIDDQQNNSNLSSGVRAQIQFIFKCNQCIIYYMSWKLMDRFM